MASGHIFGSARLPAGKRSTLNSRLGLSQSRQERLRDRKPLLTAALNHKKFFWLSTPEAFNYADYVIWSK